VADLPTGLKEPRSTVHPVEEKAVILAFHLHTLLPQHDCLHALQSRTPHLTRLSLQRHGIGRLPDIESDREPKKKFKSDPIGYLHIVIAEVQTPEGNLYLSTAIDRTAKLALVHMV
jgi:hypothetical protein